MNSQMGYLLLSKSKQTLSSSHSCVKSNCINQTVMLHHQALVTGETGNEAACQLKGPELNKFCTCERKVDWQSYKALVENIKQSLLLGQDAGTCKAG